MKPYPVLAGMLALALAHQPTHAQSFFDKLLKSTAIDGASKLLADKLTPGPDAAPQADTGAAEAAPQSAEDKGRGAPSVAGTTTGIIPKHGCVGRRGTPMPPVGPRPAGYTPAELWPDGGCPVFSFGELEFHAAKELKQQFDKASRVKCSDCEGGYGYDSWAHFFVIKSGDYKKQFQAMMLALEPGQSIAWKGQQYTGTVKALSAHPIGDVACRQFQWTMKDGKKIVTERPGLLCKYKPRSGIEERWYEIV